MDKQPWVTNNIMLFKTVSYIAKKPSFFEGMKKLSGFNFLQHYIYMLLYGSQSQTISLWDYIHSLFHHGAMQFSVKI